jgi:NAD(P)-dependent dehydrogenase (short-subunit alcohol dehydrogenase family)
LLKIGLFCAAGIKWKTTHTTIMNAHFNFSGKTALITGGVSGIGAATSLAFARAGASVIACGLTDAELDAARADKNFAGVRIEKLDVRDGAAVNALVGSLTQLDVVVHCAGMIARAAEHDPVRFAEVIDVNLNGGMRVSTAARPLLAQSKGAIVFIGSVMSYFGGPVQPAYSASKGGVKNLVMSLGCAYAAEGIRVNGVAPGWVITELSRGARENPERAAQINARIPMQRWADTAEIADPILFLCSDAARYITGSMLAIDGGYMSVG